MLHFQKSVDLRDLVEIIGFERVIVVAFSLKILKWLPRVKNNYRGRADEIDQSILCNYS